MIVVDVNIIVHLFISGSHSQKAKNLYNADPEWRVPDLWIHEMTNVLSSYVKHGGVNLSKAKSILSNVYDYFGENTYSMNSQNVLEISVEYNISGYDATYISLAVANDVSLFTLDKKLAAKVPGIAKTL